MSVTRVSDLDSDVIFRRAVDQVPQLQRGLVWCRSCGREQKVDSLDCLRNGWPKCCAHTMTIDHPDTWKAANAD